MDLKDRYTLLREHNRIPSGVQVPIFGTIDSIVKDRIEKEYYQFTYKGDGFFPGRDIDINPVLSTPEYRRGYCSFKYAVAKVLAPKSIVEIGVGAGNSALAFMNAVPNSTYIGIDNCSKAINDDFNYNKFVFDKMKQLGVDLQYIYIDSKELMYLPEAELVHIDGDHTYSYALNDIKLALNSRALYILIDDAFDPAVMKAAFTALIDNGGGYRWIFFEDTFTGNLLLLKT